MFFARIMTVAVMCLFMASASGAEAGQSSASFSVGISIHKGAVAPRPAVRHGKFTERAAAISMWRQRYHNIVAAGQQGENYWFVAHRDGKVFVIAVSSLSGRVVKVSQRT